jgi:hypothetical protein
MTIVPPSRSAELQRRCTERPEAATGFSAAYERVIDGHSTLAEVASASIAPADADAPPHEPPSRMRSSEIGRAMYARYLDADFASAIGLAERLLREQPEHLVAQLVVASLGRRSPCASPERDARGGENLADAAEGAPRSDAHPH